MSVKIALVGNGLTRDSAPFNDRSWQIWTTGSVAKILPRANEVFDIHGDGVQPDDVLNGLDVWSIWLKEKRETIHRSQTFDIERLIDRFGKIFNCSMTMMLAEAIRRNADKIALYGVDFAEGYEPEFRVTFVYLLGIARGMGIDVDISPGSLLFGDYHTYQYDAPDARVAALRRNLTGWRADLGRAENSAQYLRGAIDAAESCMRIFGGNK